MKRSSDSVIIAHRGASFLAKQENTLEAFKLAIEIKADYVEFDVRRTKDKKLVVYHDPDIHGKEIKDLTYEELYAESTADGFTVPLLSSVLRLCHRKIKLDIELKEAGYEKQVIKMVTGIYNYDCFMMKSFLDKVVARIKYYDPNIVTGLLLGIRQGDAKRRFNEYFPERRITACQADFVSPYQALATRFFIRRMHLLGAKVYVWTVNDPKNIAKLLRKKVDGIITDKPDAGMFVRKNSFH